MTQLDLSNTAIITGFSKENKINELERFIRKQMENNDALDFITEFNEMNIWLGKDILSTLAMTNRTNKFNALLIKKGIKPFIYHITIDGTRYDRSIYINK